jgi:hypothetical protein
MTAPATNGVLTGLNVHCTVPVDTTDDRRRSASPVISTSPSDMDKEREIENQDARMRKAWNKVMSVELGTPDHYVSVAVLIIHWSESLDHDLNTSIEVCACERYPCAEKLTENRLNH